MKGGGAFNGSISVEKKDDGQDGRPAPELTTVNDILPFSRNGSSTKNEVSVRGGT